MELLENLKTYDIEGLKSVIELLKKDFYEDQIVSVKINNNLLPEYQVS